MSRFQSRHLSLALPIASLFGSAILSPAHAVEVSMFGPRTVVRAQGAPQEELFNFNVPVARDSIVRVDTTNNQ